MLDAENNYMIENYHEKPVFSSFLPGISGERGIPLWCYYINRGQCIASFGVQDKDHAIMEFYPAHQAYERTQLLGFRTFLRINGRYEEAFADRNRRKRMIIGMNSLSIEERSAEYCITVEYETLPQETSAALMRKVRITNLSEKEAVVEAADGMAEIVPYGVNSSTMKEMGQTAKAWMEVLDVKSGVPRFKVRASMEDTAQVSEIKGMNFAFARNGEGELLPVIVDREILFGQDTALIRAWNLEESGIEDAAAKEQVTCNDVPCGFFLEKKTLKPGETLIIKEIYGNAPESKNVEELVELSKKPDWFEKKQKEAIRLTKALTDRIATKTGDPVFDAYCRQNYLDNLLRGGYPFRLSPEKTMYLYSRKHGDIERDYNFFSMLAETYSQGNGNFRDVNQNRRCDVYFSPFVKEENIKTFYNALQLNGYNPLVIEKVAFRLPAEKLEKLEKEERKALEALPSDDRSRLEEAVISGFTPGELDAVLRRILKKEADRKELFTWILDHSVSEDRTEFKEGYWCDHWTYNLDLVEAYLAVYPDEEKKLLFEDASYRYRQADKVLLPRLLRYVKTPKGIRQYHFLKDNADTKAADNQWLKDRAGRVAQANLASKMMTLIITKMAALDPYGMGIEMEGGKPGWYDALNGLPGLLGSSMAETYELKRCVRFLLQTEKRLREPIALLKETGELAESIICAAGSCKEERKAKGAAIRYWNMVNDAKEHFWEATSADVLGEYVNWSCEKALEVLRCFKEILDQGIEKANRLGQKTRPTYFYYHVRQWEETPEGIRPLAFEVVQTPDFLEGSVHSLKIEEDPAEKRNIYQNVRNSRLYDKKLRMYKVNASLNEASMELGRVCAFTPGWLENESIWLHMEYKYLLELLKSGLYEEFIEDFHHAAVPFLDETQYGRSPLENSSFLASSVNPNPKHHGRGFVARLSGSTAEFLEIWEIMMFGKKAFSMQKGELAITFSPCIPSYLIGEDKRVEAVFRGNIPTVYELPDRNDFIPGNYQVDRITVTIGEETIPLENRITGELAEYIRAGRPASIAIKLARMEN